jgi:putative salt-induced outer membrane protein
MMKNQMKVLSASLGIAIAMPVSAADDGWTGSVSGGYVATSGNSESSAANLRGEGKYTTGRWQHSALASAISGGQKDGSTGFTRGTADTYSAGVKTLYDLTERYYAFGSADWLRDRFSAYDFQIYEASGLGWHALTGPVHTLDVEAGPGLRQARFQVAPPGQTDRDQNEAVGLLRGIYTWAISETATFVQRASVVSGSDNTYWETGTELKAGIVGNVGLVLGYIVKRNSDVLPGVDKTDTFTTVGIEYKF